MAQDPLNATLLERIDLNHELALFRVKYNDGHTAEFSPGQFATLGLPDPDAKPPSPTSKRRGPKLIRRAYSIASSPPLTQYLEFYIVRVEGGKLTPKLWELKAGDCLSMGDKITGNFTLDDIPQNQNLIMIGTGTGLAPYRSMYHTHANSNPPRWKNFILFDGCRLAHDLGYLDEMQQLDKNDDAFQYLPTITREPADSSWSGLRGRVTDYCDPAAFKKLTHIDLTPTDCHIFLCGNPAMIDQCERIFTAQGFVTQDREHPDGTIHLERYW